MARVLPRFRGGMEELDEQYVRRDQPVIIDGFLDGRRAEQVNTVEKAVQQFGHIEGKLALDEAKMMLAATKRRSFFSKSVELPKMTIADYIANRRDPGMMFFIGDSAAPFLDIVEGAPAIIPKVREFSVYFGNHGNSTHLHYDEHLCHNVLYQLFGRKEVVLIPASSSHKLLPFGPISRVYLENMSEAERGQFADWAGGYHFTLNPGEAVFLPSGIWHYMGYPESGMSLSFRFGPNAYLRSLLEVIDYFHATPEFLQLTRGFVDDRNVDPQYRRVFREIELVSRSKYWTRSRRFWAIQRTIERLHSELFPGQAPIYLDAYLRKRLLLGMQFAKGDGKQRLTRTINRLRKAAEIPQAMECFERYLYLYPDDRKMRQEYAQLRAQHPGVAPAEKQQITMLD